MYCNSSPKCVQSHLQIKWSIFFFFGISTHGNKSIIESWSTVGYSNDRRPTSKAKRNMICDGDELRSLCKAGDHEGLALRLAKKPNVCSTDSSGLCPLHYAVWNGHIKCVKLLLANPRGVDKMKIRRSCVNMQSIIGYTPLHLAALDCPAKAAYEVTLLLLQAGADFRIRCYKGKTAHDIAIEHDKKLFSDALRDYQSGNDTRISIQHCIMTETEDPRKPMAHVEFLVPSKISQVDRPGRMAKELDVHEKQIKGLIEYGSSETKGVDTLRCLSFTQQQALLNMQRREKLFSLFQNQSGP